MDEEKISDEKMQEFKALVKGLSTDISTVVKTKDVIFAGDSLDLMFLMDCTGSMGSWIEACKKEVTNIINYVAEMHSGTKIRSSFIGYRDIGDNGRIDIQPFSTNLQEVKNFISKEGASGGADLPEDIAGGFKAGLAQQWQSSARYAVLIADAPCHGKKYHTMAKENDTYYDGDPDGLEPINQIKEFASLGVIFYAIKITEHTDKMFAVLSEAYQEVTGRPIIIENLGQASENFGFFIGCTVSGTVNRCTIEKNV